MEGTTRMIDPNTGKSKHRPHFLGQTNFYNLNAACRTVDDALRFGWGTYLVGWLFGPRTTATLTCEQLYRMTNSPPCSLIIGPTCPARIGISPVQQYPSGYRLELGCPWIFRFKKRARRTRIFQQKNIDATRWDMFYEHAIADRVRPLQGRQAGKQGPRLERCGGGRGI